ncbi:unnamed protein product, partial [Staurois parvus]
CRKLALSSRFYQRFKRKMENRVYKHLHLKFFLTLPVPDAVLSHFSS